ncbi:tetratricopeptide repeat protein [Telmatocola sphagniphila]|uniref:Tetratricopeptide repeat protein n=1 Tax=Telmatocola sphagniphila TaxID=1123043 RepID=A0A8E6ETH5_9BACT|nr:tetratricopeptide repeat protein [Telmatocola sphagniphila]QVL30100.1 tetratricopeptide repeat protein [Telmatocola sphagniphila]
MRYIPLLVLLLLPAYCQAGVYYSKEIYADLPANFRGFLLDHRALRTIGITPTDKFPATLQREQYEAAAKQLRELAKSRSLSAEEAADLGAVLIRLNRLTEALDWLREAARQHPKNFAIAANLGTAWQLTGDLNQAEKQLEESVRLAPEKWKPYEATHLKLIRLRKAKATPRDNFFGIDFTGSLNRPTAGQIDPEQKKKLPANDVALIEQLALWLPSDGPLLWQMAELANAHGDVRTAASIIEGCVSEFGMGQGDIRERRRIYKEAADEIAKLPDSEHAKFRSDIKFLSARPLVRRINPANLPEIKKGAINLLPWPALGETTIQKPFKIQYLPYLEKLDGTTVTITGFEFSTAEAVEINNFLLLEFPIGCWFCESPEPTGLIQVELAAGKATTLQRGPVQVVGKLVLNKNDPEDYVFTLKDAKVKAVD